MYNDIISGGDKDLQGMTIAALNPNTDLAELHKDVDRCVKVYGIAFFANEANGGLKLGVGRHWRNHDAKKYQAARALAKGLKTLGKRAGEDFTSQIKAANKKADALLPGINPATEERYTLPNAFTDAPSAKETQEALDALDAHKAPEQAQK